MLSEGFMPPFPLSPHHLFVIVTARCTQAQQASLRWDLGLLRAVVYFMGPHLLPAAARLTALLQTAFSVPSRVRQAFVILSRPLQHVGCSVQLQGHAFSHAQQQRVIVPMHNHAARACKSVQVSAALIPSLPCDHDQLF